MRITSVLLDRAPGQREARLTAVTIRLVSERKLKRVQRKQCRNLKVLHVSLPDIIVYLTHYNRDNYTMLRSKYTITRDTPSTYRLSQHENVDLRLSKVA